MNVGDSVPANQVRAVERAKLRKRMEEMAEIVNGRRTCGRHR